MSDAQFQEHLDKLDRQVDALKSAITNARRMRLCIVLAGITMLAVVIFLFVGLAKQITSDEFVTEMTTEAQTELENNQDRYVEQLRGLVDDTAPVIWKAFYEQSKKDTPKYSVAFNRERDTYSQNMQDALRDRVYEKYVEILKSHEGIIAEEFPRLADENRRSEIIASMELAMSKIVQTYYVDRFEAELSETYAVWDAFPAAEEPGEGSPTLEDRMMEIFTQVVTMVITQLNSTPATS